MGKPQTRIGPQALRKLLTAFIETNDKTAAGRAVGVSRETARFHIRKWLRGEYVHIPGIPDFHPHTEASFQSSPPPAAPTISPELPESHDVIARLRKDSFTLDEIAGHFQITRGQAVDLLDRLKLEGANLHEFDGRYQVMATPAQGFPHHPDRFEYESDENGWFHFGVVADTHIGSKYARLDILHDLYDIYARDGITKVYHAGNWVEGVARFNKFDLLPGAHGMEEQVEMFIRDYPQRSGMNTFFIDGDDHEGWWSQREGVEVGRFAEMKAHKAGRADLRYLSYMEAFITLRHKRTGAANKMLVQHPGGGSSYAESYTVQKIIESFQGGEKPAILICGHYHKMSYNLVRNVHALQPGCTKDQDIWGRKKRLHYTLGGVSIRMKMDEKGAIVRFQPEFHQYFDRGYYNNQWSQSGPITQGSITKKAGHHG